MVTTTAAGAVRRAARRDDARDAAIRHDQILDRLGDHRPAPAAPRWRRAWRCDRACGRPGRAAPARPAPWSGSACGTGCPPDPRRAPSARPAHRSRAPDAPCPSPPMAGLQDISPMVSTLCVTSAVRAPRRAEAAAASHPAWPPPITITSKWVKPDICSPMPMNPNADPTAQMSGKFASISKMPVLSHLRLNHRFLPACEPLQKLPSVPSSPRPSSAGSTRLLNRRQHLAVVRMVPGSACGWPAPATERGSGDDGTGSQLFGVPPSKREDIERKDPLPFTLSTGVDAKQSSQKWPSGFGNSCENKRL